MMKLVVLSGDMAGVEFPVDRPQMSLGRHSESDVCLPLDMRISRQHARMTQDGCALVLEDVGSTNGTFVGQLRIHSPTPVRPAAKFRMGRTWLEVVSVQEPSGDSAAEQVVLVELDGDEGEDDGEEETPGAGAPNVVFTLDADRPRVHPADAQESQRRLAVLLDFGQSLGSILELPRLLRVAIDRIMEAVPAEQASLLLVDAKSDDLVPRVARSRSAELSEGEVRISRHMVTQALDQRLAVLTTDATTDARFLEAESVQDLRIRSAMCAPLVARGTAIGVIYLSTSSGTHVFSEQDVHLVAGIAAQTAIAIQNARLFTDLRNAYEELQSAQDQLVRSERISTIGMLATSIAHDMANITTPLKPLIDMLLSGRELDERARGVLQRQTDRLLALVERILSFSRVGDIDLRPTGLNAIVENTLSLIETELRHRRVGIELHLADDLPPVQADGAQMERALLNLMVNAAEALEDSEDAMIDVRTDVEEGEPFISVTDNGPGIPVDIQQRLFEPFFTTKENGTGLGLYSCRRIVEDEHRGTLEVDSREGMGTTITIRLTAETEARVLQSAVG